MNDIRPHAESLAARNGLSKTVKGFYRDEQKLNNDAETQKIA